MALNKVLISFWLITLTYTFCLANEKHPNSYYDLERCSNTVLNEANKILERDTTIKSPYCSYDFKTVRTTLSRNRFVYCRAKDGNIYPCLMTVASPEPANFCGGNGDITYYFAITGYSFGRRCNVERVPYGNVIQ